MGGSVDEHGHLYNKNWDINEWHLLLFCSILYSKGICSAAPMELRPALFELPISCSHLVMHTVPCHSLVGLVVRIIRSQILSEKDKKWSPMRMRSVIIIRPSLPAKLTTFARSVFDPPPLRT